MTVDDTTINDNGKTSGRGGGIDVEDYSTLTVEMSTVTGNDGWGIFASSALTVDHSTVSGNGGVGIAFNGAFADPMTVDHSTINDNSGDGIFVASSAMTVDHTHDQ